MLWHLIKKTKNKLEMNKEKEIIEVLKSIYDPEIPVNVYDLGLIYNIEITENNVLIKMTLTSPNCPIADVILYQIESRIKLIEGIEEVKIELVWEPEWNKDMISEEGQLKLGLL